MQAREPLRRSNLHPRRHTCSLTPELDRVQLHLHQLPSTLIERTLGNVSHIKEVLLKGNFDSMADIQRKMTPMMKPGRDCVCARTVAGCGIPPASNVVMQRREIISIQRIHQDRNSNPLLPCGALRPPALYRRGSLCRCLLLQSYLFWPGQGKLHKLPVGKGTYVAHAS